MLHRHLVGPLGVAGALVVHLHSGAARAQGPHDSGERRTSAHPHHVVAVEALGAAHEDHGTTETAAGVGMRYAHDLPMHLELEVGAAYLQGPYHDTLPAMVEVLRLFEVSDELELFVGAGPGAEVTLDDHAHVYPGLFASGGAHWFWDSAKALRLEVGYAALRGRRGTTITELEVGIGSTIRF